MVTQFEIDGLIVGVVRKKIRHVYLRVYPTGDIRITAPMRASLDAIQTFTQSRLGWIKDQQQQLRERASAIPPVALDPTEIYVWGTRYQLQIVESAATPRVELRDGTMLVQLRPGTSRNKRQAIIDQWYVQQLERVIPELIAKWEPRMGVKVAHVSIRKMKTRWGSCSPHTRRIRLNLDLATKPFSCLEYVVVHELVHLLEPSHNHRFVAFMDRFLDGWRAIRKELNAEVPSGACCGT